MISSLFIKNCSEAVYAEHFAPIYDAAVKECDERGVFFLEAEYIKAVNSLTDAYPRILDLLLLEAERVKQNEGLKRYALFLYKAMLERKLFLENLSSFTLPDGVELFAFLCLIPMIKNTYETLVKIGIDKDIIDATVKQYEGCVFIYAKRFDKLGMNKRYFDWMQYYVDCEILNIGRLRFEIHRLSEPVSMLREISSGKDFLVMCGGEFNARGLYADTPPIEKAAFTAEFFETETEYIAHPVSDGGRALPTPRTYPKSEYKKIIGRGDATLSVHIPVEGELSAAACKESYERAMSVFARFFPSLDIKGFVCYSWMMSPELSEHVKPTSRILGFASPYVRFPIRTEGEDVLNFVFYLTNFL